MILCCVKGQSGQSRKYTKNNYQITVRFNTHNGAHLVLRYKFLLLLLVDFQVKDRSCDTYKPLEWERKVKRGRERYCIYTYILQYIYIYYNIYIYINIYIFCTICIYKYIYLVYIYLYVYIIYIHMVLIILEYMSRIRNLVYAKEQGNLQKMP